jgi:hypothetical protein
MQTPQTPLTADGQVRRLLPQVSATAHSDDEAVEIWKSGRGRPSAEVEGPRRCDRTPQRHDFTIEEPPLFTTAHCRRLLGLTAGALSDQAIEDLQQQMRGVADVALSRLLPALRAARSHRPRRPYLRPASESFLARLRATAVATSETAQAPSRVVWSPIKKPVIFIEVNEPPHPFRPTRTAEPTPSDDGPLKEEGLCRTQ